MNCVNHPEVTASAFCRECGKPMCEECRRPAFGSIYCAEHLPAAAASPYTAPAPAAASPYTAPAPAPRDPANFEMGPHPVLALILGFIPGVGAIYNGQYAKGLIHAVVFGLLVSITAGGHGNFNALFGLLIAAWVFYMAFEAYHTARNRRYGVAVEEFSSLFDIRPTQGRFPAGAILLIALGFVLLLNTTDIIDIDQLQRYWPVGLIVFGFYLLYARLGSGNRNRDGVPGRSAEARK